MDVLKKYEKHLITPKDKIKKNPSKVGKAAFDILSKKQETQTVEETIEAMTSKYFEKLMEAVNEGCKAENYPNVFYVLVERKKETLMGNVNNVLKHKYLTLPFKPKAKVIKEERPSSDFDLYEIDRSQSSITYLWTLPSDQDAISVLKNKELYDPQYVKWIEDYNKGVLDL